MGHVCLAQYSSLYSTDGVLASVELGARKAYPRESGLAELHVLNSAETLAQELGRTETVAALAATWLAASEVGMRVSG